MVCRSNSHREAARLRQLAGEAQDRLVNHSILAANARRHDVEGEFHWPPSAHGEMEFRCRKRPQPTQFAAEARSASPKARSTCGAAGREDRDVRHQDRKHAFRGRVSREGAGVRENSGPLVEGIRSGTSLGSAPGSVVDHSESVGNHEDRHRRIHDG